MRPKLIASTCQLLLLLCKAEQSEARVAIKFRRLEQMLRTRAGWNAKESRAFEHVCLEKLLSVEQILRAGDRGGSVECRRCLRVPPRTHLPCHTHSPVGCSNCPFERADHCCYVRQKDSALSFWVAILSQIIVIEMFGLARSVKAKGFERSSTCGQRALYHARPGWP